MKPLALACQNCGTADDVQIRSLDLDLPWLRTCGLCWFALGDPDMRRRIWKDLDDAHT